MARIGQEKPDGRGASGRVMRLALPAVTEMALVSLVGAADTMMVGRILGAEALAAVGLTFQPRMLLLCLFFALSTGVTAVVARRKGEDNLDAVNETLGAGLLLALVTSAALAAAAFVWAAPLLRLAGGDRAENEQVLSAAAAYFRVTVLSLPCSALSLCICAAQRGIGKTQTALWVNGAGNGVNVLLNFCLIGGRWGFPRLAVTGEALASAAGTAVSFLLALLSVSGKKGDLPLSPRAIARPAKDSLRALLRVSGNAAAEQAGLRLGYFLSARILFSLGTAQFAANQICMQLSGLTFTLGDGLGAAGTALVGQALGKQRPPQAMRDGLACRRFAVLGSLIFGALLILFRRELAGWFIGKQTENGGSAAAWAAQTMVALALIQPFQTGAAALAGCLRGGGGSRYVAVVSLLCVSILRPMLTFLAVKGLHFALPGAWLLGFSEVMLRYLLFARRFSQGAPKQRRA